jgi:hypothetical protein
MAKFKSRPIEVKAVRVGELLASLAQGLDGLKWWGISLTVDEAGVKVWPVSEGGGIQCTVNDWLVRDGSSLTKVVWDADFRAKFEEVD